MFILEFCAHDLFFLHKVPKDEHLHFCLTCKDSPSSIGHRVSTTTLRGWESKVHNYEFEESQTWSIRSVVTSDEVRSTKSTSPVIPAITRWEACSVASNSIMTLSSKEIHESRTFINRLMMRSMPSTALSEVSKAGVASSAYKQN